MLTTPRPYELSETQLGERLDEMVDVTFADLTSQFLLLPRGDAFVTYQEFRSAYDALRMSTRGFVDLTPESCWDAFREDARAFIVLRAILGLSPPEWQDVTATETGQTFPPNTARSLDGKIKRDPAFFTTSAGATTLTTQRVTAMLEAACSTLDRGADTTPDGLIHRLDKIDTREGLVSVRHTAEQHVPYAVLLYERYLGRPLASHRDSVSELVGDVMENAIEEQLAEARVPFRKTKRAERIVGFDQAPDFITPDEEDPSVVIEAKITGDDGTARDKVARILRLAAMRDAIEAEGGRPWQLVACIDGRGFGVRRQDLRDLLAATQGKVFTLNTVSDLVDATRLTDFAPR